MKYRNPTTLVCVDHTKDACLYFSEVIPLNLAHIIPWENNGDLEAFDILKRILPASLLDSSHPTGLHALVLSYIDSYVNVFPYSIGISDSPFDKQASDQRARAFFPILMKRKDELIDSLGYPINSIFGAGSVSDESDAIEDPAIVLTGLKLIDTSQITWRQIIEIRKDKESLNKLRRLRTFIFQNYQGKPTNFIKDDLLNRIDLYESTIKQLGLKTSDSALKILFNSGTLVANSVAAIASALTGMHVTIPLSLGIASSFLLGNVTLEIRTHKRELYKFKQENPITYLLDINKTTR